ncbi:MAG: PilZ domain-containing protein [Phycisphaerae bacterium]
MRLTCQVIEQILTIRSDTPTRRQQRKHPRVGARLKAVIAPCTVDDNGIKPLVVRIRDISARGIGLVSSRRLAKGHQFTLFISQADSKSVRVICAVRHCRALPDGSFTIGASMIAAVPNPGEMGTAKRLRAGCFLAPN